MEILNPILSLFAQWSHVLVPVAIVCMIAGFFVGGRAGRNLSWVIVVIAVPLALLSLLSSDMLGALVWGFNAFVSIRNIQGRPFTFRR